MFLNYYCKATKEYCRLNKDNHKKIGLKLDKRLMDDFQAACICDECKTNQPERSKREDLTDDQIYDLCKIEYHHGCCFVMSEETQKAIRDLVKMRCSEHCGNTVRDK